MFRYKSGIKLSYERQGYIYFVSRLYSQMSIKDRRRIEEHCLRSGGEYHKALLEYVTTDAAPAAICIKHCLSKSNLYRFVKKYYESFPEDL